MTQQEFSEALVRFGLLIGNPSRTDAEDAEMESLSRQFELDGNHPGWKPCPRGGALPDALTGEEFRKAHLAPEIRRLRSLASFQLWVAVGVGIGASVAHLTAPQWAAVSLDLGALALFGRATWLNHIANKLQAHIDGQ